MVEERCGKSNILVVKEGRDARKDVELLRLRGKGRRHVRGRNGRRKGETGSV